MSGLGSYVCQGDDFVTLFPLLQDTQTYSEKSEFHNVP